MTKNAIIISGCKLAGGLGFAAIGSVGCWIAEEAFGAVTGMHDKDALSRFLIKKAMSNSNK